MRGLLAKITVIVAGVMMLGFIAVPSAQAQTYPPVFPGAIDCDALPAPSVSFVGGSIVVTFPQGTLTCILNVVIEINPVLYDGPPPASGSLSLAIPALDGDDFAITITTTSSSGVVSSSASSVPTAALTAARVATDADTDAGADDVLGITVERAAVTSPSQDLAFTGSDVQLPLVAGALLVGAGGITLVWARKRARSH